MCIVLDKGVCICQSAGHVCQKQMELESLEAYVWRGEHKESPTQRSENWEEKGL